jgi:hypothetical protein
VVTEAKRRVFVVLLGVLTVWPLVHYALSRRYHIDHWRFAGFAMYSRPAYQPSLQFAGVVDGQPLTQAALKAALGADAAEVDRFIARRRLWGDLLPPDALGRLVLDKVPGLGEVTITVVTAGMEPGEVSFSRFSRRYRCVRGPAGCVRLD